MLVYIFLSFGALIVATVVIWLLRSVTGFQEYKHTVAGRRQKAGLLSSVSKSRNEARNKAPRDAKDSSKTPWGW